MWIRNVDSYIVRSHSRQRARNKRSVWFWKVYLPSLGDPWASSMMSFRARWCLIMGRIVLSCEACPRRNTKAHSFQHEQLKHVFEGCSLMLTLCWHYADAVMVLCWGQYGRKWRNSFTLNHEREEWIQASSRILFQRTLLMLCIYVPMKRSKAWRDWVSNDYVRWYLYNPPVIGRLQLPFRCKTTDIQS